MEQWNRVNWAQVGAIVVLVAIIVAILGAIILLKVRTMHEKARRDLVLAHQNFVRSDYARLAGESEVMHSEFRTLVAEVASLARAVREAVSSDEWDPEVHLGALSRLEDEVAAVHRPPVPLYARPS